MDRKVVDIALQFSPDSTTAALRQEQLGKWWKSTDPTDAAIESGIWNSRPADDEKEVEATPEACDNTPDIIQVAILETVRAHDEVDAALVHSIASQPNVNLTLYQSGARYGSEKIFHAFGLNYTGPLNPDDFMGTDKHTTIPDFLVLTTSELALRQAPKRLEALLAQGKTRLICIVHHADHWAEEERKADIRPWVDANMIEFWTLSPHTAAFLSNTIAAWDSNADEPWDNPPAPPIRVFVPIFPIDTAVNTTATEQESQDLSFAMQGDYDPHRRDYKHIFERLGNFLAAAEGERNVSMHLLGQGQRPSVPENVASHVFFDQSLSYIDFYGLLAKVSAVLPGFASPEYLDRKASSSVPAALIAGTPLVADRRLLAAYAYVEEESVWLQEDGENEFDVVGRMLSASAEQRAEKSEHAKANAERIIQGNIRRVGEWFGEGIVNLYCSGGSEEEEED
ncbi:hypothetical protein M436DRAFT_55730 [Aureobasidium namibiae CBS 147.97]|uniref:Glycosyltransferase family 1 protein n=1 Tax=Aureobasidium namibiae CBS 147.97 TaxID=1043004 RepID=A0A074WI25_9PEZI|nr:uncharacterized protein M436DRAFT_55730 [Aureobasidium namibiae CBS 147.97]KEQ69477.1 hypothetical protein M436DRAFT_55730 [Aureobasidium namibiae CBS 147.97]